MEITQTKLNKWSKLADEAAAIADVFGEQSYTADNRNGAMHLCSVESAWVKVAYAIREALNKTPLPSKARW